MAAPPLQWQEDKGYDIHLLRGGPESARLIDDLDLDPGQAASVTFVPNLQADVSRHGVQLDASTGVVKALLHPDPSFPKVNNFLLAAVFGDASGSYETVIRIHVHDSVNDIWLTPPTLTVHQSADENRFSVLARFNDLSVGDITDWAGLSYESGNQEAVTVSGTGILKAEATSGSASITARLTLSSLNIDKTSTAGTATAGPSWADIAKAATVSFVAGGIVPNLDDPDSGKPDSVKSVVNSGANILLIAEGFQNEQRFDYRNIVNTIARVLRGDEGAFATAFQPFNLLKNSINFWTVFIPSVQNGVTVLGEYSIAKRSRLVGFLPESPKRPKADAETWDYREFLYEVALPVQADATRTLSALVADWQQLYGDHVTEQRVSPIVQNLELWKVMPFHSPLNERDTAFGVTIGYRPRALLETRFFVEMDLSPRRTSHSSLVDFVGNLAIAGFPIGARWKNGGADSRLVAFLCLSDRFGGWENGSGFSLSTGLEGSALYVKTAPDSGLEVETEPVKSTHRHVMASVFAHELAHAFGLGDEYGDGEGTTLLNGSNSDPFDPNVQAKVVIAPTIGSDPPSYDSTKIKWLYPRFTAAGVLAANLTDSDISDTGIRVSLVKSDSKHFEINDVVRFWENLQPTSFDRFANDFFRVTKVAADGVTIVPVNLTAASNSTTDADMSAFDHHLFLDHFSAGYLYSLVRPLRVAGAEVKLVPPPILKQIDDSKGPLNAPAGSPTAACVAAQWSGSVMSPTNLPALSRMPRTRADIVGIYEGGSYHDCGVFRPAGRCRMREDLAETTPFCHVCRYVIVNMVNPSVHGHLDTLYPEVSI